EYEKARQALSEEKQGALEALKETTAKEFREELDKRLKKALGDDDFEKIQLAANKLEEAQLAYDELEELEEATVKEFCEGLDKLRGCLQSKI
ncbi:MAG TPA: hypothetical protein VFO37_04975, partial [Chitinophagaceae bacterium]|nr:hypothetical protein [Chitinophagaceae bacterium]